MMMEEAGENGSSPDNGNGDYYDDDDDSSSRPPSFAVPPGGVEDASAESSDSRSTSPAPVATDQQKVEATADPFDLLSAPATAPAQQQPGLQQPSNDAFDAFAPKIPSDIDNITTLGSNTTEDLLGGVTANPAPIAAEIDMNLQESMISTQHKPGESPRELKSAESGDLLGLTSSTAETPSLPKDLMDSDFQTMPLAVPETTAIDPFTAAARQDDSLATPKEQPDTTEEGTKAMEDKTESSNTSKKSQPEHGSATNAPENETAITEPKNGPAIPISENDPAAEIVRQEEGHNPKEIPKVREAPDTAAEAPGSPTSTREVADESLLLEDVELASPQTENKSEDEVQKLALKTSDFRPPLTEDTKANIAGGNTSVLSEEQMARVRALEEDLAKAKDEVHNLQQQKEQLEKLQQDKQAETSNVLEELQNKLQKECEKRAAAEHHMKEQKAEIATLRTSLKEKEEQWNEQTEAWRQQLTGLEKENEALIEKAKQELEDRKEHERRERVLANKLNMVKKQQATKTDVEEVYADDLRLLKGEVAAKTKQVEELQQKQTSLTEELDKEKAVAKTRIEQLEKAVREEKQLNEERKTKMKSFIESKADELREAKEESEHYQTELTQTNQSLVDLNNRWKTLHAQWVQSQTRNRELQRDLNKIKKDSENLHKKGDSLNVKLSHSANEMEQHKNKRLAAKQELMSMLGQLEAEREITNKLRDSIRFTFTAKAQSQHQLLQENLTELNKQLEALARRLGRPIPLTNDGSQSLSSLVMAAVDESEASESGDFSGSSPTNGGQEGKTSGPSKEQRRILVETTRLLGKLENETQRISQGIMALTSSIEQMNQLIQGGGEKTCFTSLNDIFFGGGFAKALESGQTSGSRANGGRPPVRYGHSSHLPTEGGTMT